MTKTVFSRDDVRLFLRPAISHRRQLCRFDLRISFVGLFGAALVYATALLPSLLSLRAVTGTRVPGLPRVVLAAPEVEPLDQTTVTTAQPIAASGLVYPNLGINAPVNWDITYQEKGIQTALQTGVVQLAGTARPGEQGTAIITGHSSNFAWRKGNYKTVFAPLLKSQLNDRLSITYNNRAYSYLVTAVYEVEPTRVDLLQRSEKVDLRLITCTPLGSTRRRLIVEAIQTYPDRSTNTPFSGQPIVATDLVATR